MEGDSGLFALFDQCSQQLASKTSPLVFRGHTDDHEIDEGSFLHVRFHIHLEWPKDTFLAPAQSVERACRSRCREDGSTAYDTPDRQVCTITRSPGGNSFQAFRGCIDFSVSEAIPDWTFEHHASLIEGGLSVKELTRWDRGEKRLLERQRLSWCPFGLTRYPSVISRVDVIRRWQCKRRIVPV